jgi:hypothetical protein
MLEQVVSGLVSQLGSENLVVRGTAFMQARAFVSLTVVDAHNWFWLAACQLSETSSEISISPYTALLTNRRASHYLEACDGTSPSTRDLPAPRNGCSRLLDPHLGPHPACTVRNVQP